LTEPCAMPGSKRNLLGGRGKRRTPLESKLEPVPHE
jgi:hypothetical protein